MTDLRRTLDTIEVPPSGWGALVVPTANAGSSG